MKLNIKNLTLIFGGLILVFFLSRSFDKKDLATFDKDALKVDTTMVDLIKLYPKAANHQEIVLEKTNNTWQVKNDKLKVEASEEAISRMLGMMQNIQLKRVVGLKKGAWKKFEVSDSLGSRVRLFNNNRVIADWWIGKFNFSPNTRSAISYVRKMGEDEVYAVNDLLSFTFNQKFNQWRNSEIITANSDEWNKIVYHLPMQNSYSVQKIDEAWMSGENKLDSAKMESYIQKLANLTNTEYVDEFSANQNQDMQLQIINGSKEIIINCWNDSINGRYVLSSSLNKTNFFSFDEQRLFDEVFVNLDSLKIMR